MTKGFRSILAGMAVPVLAAAGFSGCAPMGVSAPPAAPSRPVAAAQTPWTSSAPESIPVPGAETVPTPGTPVAATASGGTISTRTIVQAPIDSTTPSPEARAVLETIRDPVPAAERVAPPEAALRSYAEADRAEAEAARGVAPADTLDRALEADASNDSIRSVVPVPTPTKALGQDRPRLMPAIPDSALDALMQPDSAAAPPAAPGNTPLAPATAVPPDSCWRVQVKAPEEADVAEQVRAAAQSLLLVPMVIEKEGGLYKVRTRDCLHADAAARLKDRAETSGFPGAFRFRPKR